MTTKAAEVVPEGADRSSTVILNREQVTAVLSELESEFPELFEKLNLLGIHDSDFESPFTGMNHSDNFQNVLETTALVTSVASRLAKLLETQGSITSEMAREVVRGAVLHNGLKRLEALSRTELTHKLYSREWFESVRTTLAGLGLEEEFDTAARYRQMVGHTSLTRFVEVDTSGDLVLKGELPHSEMILHIASDMVAGKNKKYSGDDYTPDVQIGTFDEKARYASFEAQYPFLYTEGVAYGSEGIRNVKGAEELAPGEKFISFYDLQVFVFDEVSRKILSELQLSSTENPARSLLKTVNTPTKNTAQATAQSVGDVMTGK